MVADGALPVPDGPGPEGEDGGPSPAADAAEASSKGFGRAQAPFRARPSRAEPYQPPSPREADGASPSQLPTAETGPEAGTAGG